MQKQFIAAVAGSAGSLYSLKQFFCQLPCRQVSYLIVQHLPMNYKSQLSLILEKHSNLTVQEPIAGTRIMQDGVYLTPPNKYVTVKDDIIDLMPRAESPNRSIDVLLKSLADNSGDRAIAVILSGTGSDGVAGIKAIKQTGGLTLAQTPDSCVFPSMPMNAIQTGCVDHVLSCGDMADAIQDYVQRATISKNFRSSL